MTTTFARELLGDQGWSDFVDLMFAPGPTTRGCDRRPLPERGVPAALRESVRRQFADMVGRRLLIGSGSGVPQGIVTL